MPDPNRKLRPLLIAEACNPEFVSVPLEGWSHARAIASMSDAHLVTQIRNRDAILRTGLAEGRDVTFINSEAAARPAYQLANLLRGGKGKGWTAVTALSALAYPYFEHVLWKKFGPRIRNGEFDVVHRLTPLSPTMPSFIAAKCASAGVPFVIGPLNGGVPWPKGFDTARRKEREWLSYVRDAYKLLPGYLSTRRHASAILVGSRDTWKQMPRSFHSKCFYVAENAIDPGRFTIRRKHQATRPIKIVFVGRLVPYKGADMLLEAAAPLVKSGDVTVEIIGDGPQKADLARILSREGIDKGVTLAGWVPHTQLQDHLAAADVFGFPSVREFGGAVALEAMAVGAVPIVVEYGGPAELVTPASGFLIPIGSRAQIIAAFRDVLASLAKNPARIDDKSDAALCRARQKFCWEAKARQVLAVYHWVLGIGPRPELPMPTPD
jgi:glycosyltransferase involved in cell wall biosynthesis